MNKNRYRHKLLYQDVLKQVQKEDIAFFSQCGKFNQQNKITLDRAIQYLWLKDHAVDRKIALKFGQRRICKIDCTKTFDGPPTARILKTEKIPQGAINGWQNGTSDPKYDLGKQYSTDSRQQNENELLYKEFLKNEQQAVEERQKEIDHMIQFNNQINKKCTFSGLNNKDLHQKLEKLKEQNRILSETPTEFVEHKGQRFYHILNEIQDYLDKKIENKTILQDMRAFQSMTTLDKKLRVQQLQPGEPLIQHQESRNSMRHLSLKVDQRDRAMTNEVAFNEQQYIFKVMDIPSMAQQQKQINQQKLMDYLQENSMRTPREASPIETTRSKKSQLSNQRTSLDIKLLNSKLMKSKRSQFFLKVPTEQSQSQNSFRFASVQPTKYQIQISKDSATANTERLDSPTRRTKAWESRIHKFVQQQIDHQNTSLKPTHVDTRKLNQKLEMKHNIKRKEVERMYDQRQSRLQTQLLM